MLKCKRKPTRAEVAKAKRIARRVGLDLIVLRYSDKFGKAIRRADVWTIHCRGVEVGHWVPATGRYRIDTTYGGPAPYAEVCGRLAETHLGNEERQLRKTA